MPVLSAAALGALVGAAMPTKGRKYALRGTSRKAGYSRLAMMRRRQRSRGRYRKLSRRQWQARARRQVGNPKNFSTAKTTECVNPGAPTTGAVGLGEGNFTGANAVATKTIASVPLIVISGTSSSAIDGRSRDMCVISGIKIDATFESKSADRIYVNWAIVHGKQGQVISPATTDFFRSYQNERAFNAAHNGFTGLTSSVAQINTDEFVVLKRGKFMLTPGVVATAAAGHYYNYGASTKEKSMWLKLGRSFYFDSGSSQPQDQIYFVCWPAIPGQPASEVTTGILEFRLRSITYWREPRAA